MSMIVLLLLTLRATFATALRSSPSPRGSRRAESRLRANPFQDIVSSMSNMGMMGTSATNQEKLAKIEALVVSSLRSNRVESWDEMAQSIHTPEEQREFRTKLANGYGRGSPLHRLRLFDKSNKREDVRVTLYRDSASWCPYCQKVWTLLEEKRIPYEVEKINMRCYGEKPVGFMMKQPSGNIPVAIIDGETYNQSNDIMYALEAMFPDHKPMLPTDPKLRMRAQELLRLERSLFSAWMYWLTSRDSGGRLRESFASVLEAVEAELAATPGGFFLGSEVSLVDMMFAPFLERMCASMLFYKGFQIRFAGSAPESFPAINRWFDALETLDSYQTTKSDYYTHCYDLPPQLGGCEIEIGSEAARNAIDGIAEGSWSLPLTPDLGGFEPDWTWAGDEGEARKEAVERLTANHASIVSFACRGAGSKGFPRYSAPLADPNAEANQTLIPLVEGVLKVVSKKMLAQDVEELSICDEAITDMAAAFRQSEGVSAQVVSSLAYLRDRVGVPRDMRLPAARQLRAHLNWAIAACK